MAGLNLIRVALLAFGICLSAIGTANCEEKPESDKQEISLIQPEKPVALAIEIENLVNRNRLPIRKKNEAIEFGDDFDVDEERRVWKELKKLPPNIERLWPDLVKHIEDERYCVTVGHLDGGVEVWTVGRACRQLTSDAISEPYYRKLEPESRQVYGQLRRPSIASDRKAFKKWCEDRKDAPLYALQIEMCKWAIGELQNPKVVENSSMEQRSEWIKSIEGEIESLGKTKKAVPARVFTGERFSADGIHVDSKNGDPFGKP